MTNETKNAANVRAELTATNPNSKEAIRAAIELAIANGAKIKKSKVADVNSKRTFTFAGVSKTSSHINKAENKTTAKLNITD